MKYTVWVEGPQGIGGRTEEATSPEEARAAVQRVIDDGITKRFSLRDASEMGLTGAFTIVGVEHYEAARRHQSCEDVLRAFGRERGQVDEPK